MIYQATKPALGDYNGVNRLMPLVSIIITTFNRAATISRAVNSVLAQTYSHFELIIVDDGSADNTQATLNAYRDSRIRIFKHEINKGVTAAKNTGLAHIKGQWFTILDSDDEMKPEAIETMIRIPLTLDASVTAVTCNCWDLHRNKMTGMGLTGDQYLDVKTLMTVCKGIFWGITRTDLLQTDRFNEKLYGFESTLWYKINDRAKRYYIHKALSVIHTEGDDRITKSNRKYDFRREIKTYENIIEEKYYLNTVKKYRPSEFRRICKSGLAVMKIIKNDKLSIGYYILLSSSGSSFSGYLLYKFRPVSAMFNKYKKIKYFIKSFLPAFSKK